MLVWVDARGSRLRWRPPLTRTVALACPPTESTSPPTLSGPSQPFGSTTSDPAVEAVYDSMASGLALWTPNGQRIVFSGARTGNGGSGSRRWERAGGAFDRRVPRRSLRPHGPAIGRTLIFEQCASQCDIWAVSAVRAEWKTRPVVETPAEEQHATLSQTDGRLAVCGNGSVRIGSLRSSGFRTLTQSIKSRGAEGGHVTPLVNLDRHQLCTPAAPQTRAPLRRLFLAAGTGRAYLHDKHRPGPTFSSQSPCKKSTIPR